MSNKRVGIFAGTFDPVHTGHITFALQALELAKLDEVAIIPERKPRGKESAEHFGHRVAMIRQAIKPHPKLSLVELVESRLSITKTMPHLRTLFRDSDLAFLVGSDVMVAMPHWPNIERVLPHIDLVVGVRQGESPEAMELHVEAWPVKPRALYVFPSFAPDISSTKVRGHLRSGRKTTGVLASVMRYSRKNWLYIKFPH